MHVGLEPEVGLATFDMVVVIGPADPAVDAAMVDARATIARLGLGGLERALERIVPGEETGPTAATGAERTGSETVSGTRSAG